MKVGKVLELYPAGGREAALEGLYVGHGLRERQEAQGRPFVYANFVVSLDGRIAVPRTDGPGLTVPKQTANPRDWRLFQELAVQADVILSSGRYLRDYASGEAQEILQVFDDPEFEDLAKWRAEQGLKRYPDLAVLSASLDFPVPGPLSQGDRRVLVFTTEGADPERVRRLQTDNIHVIVAGEDGVQGARLLQGLEGRSYGTIYSAAGPRVLHLLLEDDVLDRLYLTYANRLLGGDPFAAVVDGPLLDPALDMQLVELYYDSHALDGLGQLFATYDRAR